jgi:hypothetical protein
VKKNRYSRAIKILKSTEVDERISRLNEMPTNHTTGLYALNDPGFRVGDKDPEEIFVPDVDGEWPDGVPGTPGEYRYVRPKGYWSGGKNWETVNTPDLSQNYLENDPTGRNTDGLISPDGVVKTFLPPDSRNFILGPVVDGFVPNHTSDAYTNIGYIQKDTRQFVLLARIQGQFKSGLNGNYPVWDGTSNGLTIYNQNFTLEMAQWIRDQVTSDKFVRNVPYFYSGGVPQRPQGPADCPNCPPGMYGGNGYGGGDGSGPFGWGQGGDSQDISVGNQQDPARSGDAKDAGFPWEIFKNIANKVTDAAKNAWDFATKTADAISSMFGDPKAAIESGLYNLGKSFAQQASSAGADFNSYSRAMQDTINSFKNTYNPPPYNPYNPDPRAIANMMTPGENAAFKAGGGAAALASGGKSIQDVIDQGYKNLGSYDSSQGRTTTTSSSNAELQRLMSKPPGTHTPTERQKLLDAGLDDFVRGGKTASPLGDLAILGATAALVKGAAAVGLAGLSKIGLVASGLTVGDQAKKTFVDKADSASQYNQQLAGKLVTAILSGQPQKIELSSKAKADQIKNVNVSEFEKALQIGKASSPSAEKTVNPTNKRPVLTGGWGAQGGSEVNYDPKTDTLTITSEKMLRTGQGDTRDSSGRVTRFADIPSPSDAQVSKITQDLMTGPLEPLMKGLSGVGQVTSGGKSTTWAQIKSDPTLLKVFSDNIGKQANNLATGAVQGTASNVVALRQALVNLGVPQSEIEKTGGGYGQVYSQTSYKGNEIPQELRTVIDKKTNFKETFYLKKVKSIIREQEVTQPTETTQSTQSTTDSKPLDPRFSPQAYQNPTSTGAGRVGYYPEGSRLLSWLQKQGTDRPGGDGFISGYLGGSDTSDLIKIFSGSTINPQTVHQMTNQIDKYDQESKELSLKVIEVWYEVQPQISAGIGRMRSAADAKNWGAYYSAMYEVDRLFDRHTSVENDARQASLRYLNAMKQLGSYVINGKFLPKDPFQLDDPTVARSQQERKKRDEEIRKQIEELNKAASDSKQAAQLNKLKALGMGALLAGVIVLGAAVLAKPAIVAALGSATIRIIKGLLGLSDDALKGIGAVDDIGQAGLGQVTGQLADDAASVVNKLLKGSGGEAGGQGRTLANQIQRASDEGNVELVKKLIKSADKYLYNSYQPKGKLISENSFTERQIKLLKEIKKPYKLPEIPKQKYKMNFSGKYSAQNTPDKTSSELSDALVASGNARGQKWRMEDKFWQGYETTERMNVIYDRVGHGDQYWEEIVKENQNKITWKNREIQEHLNLIAHEKAMKEENPNYESPFGENLLDEQETIQADKDPLFKRVSKKLKKDIDYPDKPSKNGDPNEPPPEMVNGYHPNYGKRKDYYKKLDPHSASAMPETGDPEIDAEVKAARKKPK